MQTRIINYRGYTIELGELEGSRKAYWEITRSPKGNEDIDLFIRNNVECGSWEDLELIAKRSIDATLERQ